ncbi:MAG: magnesium transporter, partial [Actinomycetota bacterium]
RKSWDLDSVSTPMVTALGDMATIPSLLLASFLLEAPAANAVASTLLVAVALYAAARSYTTDVPGVRRIAIEMTPVILLTPILDILAGGLLQSHEVQLFAFPAVLAIVPPFISQAGALGGIFSSRVSSKLHLGVIEPRTWPELPALVDAALVAGAGVVVFTFIGAAAYGLAVLTNLDTPGAWPMIGGTLLAGAMTIPLTLVVSYEIAIFTSRFGLDPDNHGVPIITSVMDLSGVAAFLVAMTVVGVTGG